MVSLPEPREDHYQDSDFSKTKSHILGTFDQIVESIGLYDVANTNPLLRKMSGYSGPIGFLNQMFGLLVFILASISTLLIYSLLMNNTETKIFDTGVMRMVGLNQKGFICMVFTQALAFVLPSILAGFVCACPAIYLLEKNVFNATKE